MALPQKLAPLTKWTDRLAFDFALTLEGSGESIQEIQERHNLDDETLKEIGSDKLFQARVRAYREEIVSKGLTFRLKARAQAEILLETSFDLIHNNDVPAAVKADLLKSTIKWAGLEIKEGTGDGPGSGMSITINIGNKEEPTRIIDAKVIENDS